MKVKIRDTLTVLGAPANLAESRNLPVFADAEVLEIAHTSRSGREHLLVPVAARQWRALSAAAQSEGVTLLMISGYRSFDRQLELIQARLGRGQPVDEILSVMAPPGCSEHHTGRAVDIGTPGCDPLSETFEETDAFRWLHENADRFLFQMSYPRENPWGYIYEPWHWYCHLK